MAYLSLNNLTKKFDGNTVLNKINIDVEKGTFLSLLGPSGCGKTTTLRLIGGFEKANGGEISIDGKKINDIPIYKRNIGIVFQSYALFPHMTVEENIAYGLEQRKIPKSEIKKQVAEVIEMVQLKGFEKRKPKKLSGGQQQRVALARALVIKPSVLLLDESLSALDKKLRVDMQVELRKIQKKLGITTVFVTHDQEEALTLSDQIAVMKKGEIMQMGSPEEVYEYPKNTFVANFLGEANFFKGKITKKVGHTYTMKMDNEEEITFSANQDRHENDSCILTIRPEKINLHSTMPEGPCIKGKISFVTYAGNITMYRVEALGMEIKIQRQNIIRKNMFNVGSEVYLNWEQSSSLILSE